MPNRLWTDAVADGDHLSSHQYHPTIAKPIHERVERDVRCDGRLSRQAANNSPATEPALEDVRLTITASEPPRSPALKSARHRLLEEFNNVCRVGARPVIDQMR
jgi:hypothetical protein